MKKILFIDRDGTLVEEPKIDKQLDSFDKLSFFPGVFKYLNKISEELDFKLVMVTNQDGLGTDSFPEETFWPVQNFIINSFKNEEVSFFKTHIDKIYKSDANFLLVKVDNADFRYNQLLEKGIIVRNRSNQPLCQNCLRITIGTENENKSLIKTLSQL